MSSNTPHSTDNPTPALDRPSRAAPHSATSILAHFVQPSTSRDPSLNWITAEPVPPFSRARIATSDVVMPRRKNGCVPADGDSEHTVYTDSERANSIDLERASSIDSERAISIDSESG